MNGRRLAGGVLLLATLVVSGGCAGDGEKTNAGHPIIGLVFDVGGQGDKSFNDAAYRGLEMAMDSLGVGIEAIEPDGTDRESALRLLASRGPRLIFGVGFLFTDEIRRVAEDFPETHFACIDYSLGENETLPANLRAVRFREEEGCFLVGAIAALQSVSKKIGFVGGMDIPLIRRFQAGYEAGAEYAREDVTVFVSYAGVTGEAFKNPAKGKELALAQFENGADVIFHAAGATGLGVFEAARKLRRWVIGVDSDQHAEAPGRVLTSMVKRVDIAVFDTISEELAGTFSGGVVELGLAENGVDYVYDERNAGYFAEGVHERAEELRAAVIAGEIEVPREPAR